MHGFLDGLFQKEYSINNHQGFFPSKQNTKLFDTIKLLLGVFAVVKQTIQKNNRIQSTETFWQKRSQTPKKSWTQDLLTKDKFLGGRLFCTEHLILLTKEVSSKGTLFAFWWGCCCFVFFFIIAFPLTKGKSNKEPWTRPDPGSKNFEAFFGEGDGRPKDQGFWWQVYLWRLIFEVVHLLIWVWVQVKVWDTVHMFFQTSFDKRLDWHR